MELALILQKLCLIRGQFFSGILNILSFRNEDQFLVLTLSTTNQNNRTAVLRNIESGEETKLGLELGQQQNEEVITAVTFDHRGQYVFLGTTKSRILMYDTKTKKHFKTVCQSVSHQAS